MTPNLPPYPPCVPAANLTDYYLHGYERIGAGPPWRKCFVRTPLPGDTTEEPVAKLSNDRHTKSSYPFSGWKRSCPLSVTSRIPPRAVSWPMRSSGIVFSANPSNKSWRATGKNLSRNKSTKVYLHRHCQQEPTIPLWCTFAVATSLRAVAFGNAIFPMNIFSPSLIGNCKSDPSVGANIQ